MALHYQSLSDNLDYALSNETRESLTEWIGFKRKKPLNNNKNTMANKYIISKEFWVTNCEKWESRIRRLKIKKGMFLHSFSGAGKPKTHYFDQQIKVAQQKLKKALR
jgi:hypothetical protein